MNIYGYINRSKKLIDAGLGKYLPAEKGLAIKLVSAMRYSVFSGGKRIRPVIVLEAAKVCGGCTDNALPGACAIEFVHTFSLIHDDLPGMDDDDLRRGKPTCHKVFGVGTAILAGDALLALALGVIVREMEKNPAVEVVKELAQALGTDGMVGGQEADIEYKNKGKSRRIRERINRLKTAKLFESSAKIGAISARAGRKEVDAMARYGMNLGMAFQITDDILDGEDLTEKDSAIALPGKLINDANDALKIFGNKADRLREIADFVLTRKT